MNGTATMRTTGITALVVALLHTAVVHAQPPKSPSIDDVAAAWKKRQESIKTFRIAWTQTVIYPKGGYSAAYLGKGVIFPREDTTVVEKGLVVMDGVKARYEFSGKIYSQITKDFDDNSFASVYDGKTGAQIEEFPQGGYTLVTRQSADAPPSLGTTANYPWLQALRPAALELGATDLDMFQVNPNHSATATPNSVELILRNPKNNATCSMWLDPTRDYLLVREQERHPTGSTALYQHDIQYVPNEAGGWKPAGWTLVRKGQSGTVISTIKAVVTECQIGLSVPASTFDTTPPKNSRVTEYTDKNKEESYIVRPDGSKRDILPGEEERATFQTLVQTEPGEPLGQMRRSWWARNWMSVAGAAFFVIGLSGVLYWRRRLAGTA